MLLHSGLLARLQAALPTLTPTPTLTQTPTLTRTLTLQAALPSMKADRRSLLDEEEASSGAPHHGTVRRRQYVAMYRQGQREVLTEAVTWLEGLLQAAVDGESEGEDEDEDEDEDESEEEEEEEEEDEGEGEGEGEGV